MKKKTRERINGSISIFLVIILVPMISLSGLLVDASRVQLGKSMVSSAGDLTMNSALANYDTVLKDVYGLFAMSQNETDLSANLEKYFTDTLIANGTVDKKEDIQKNPLLKDISSAFSGKSSNLLQTEVDSFSATKVPNSDLANSSILKNQIVEFMKYRAPVNVGLSFLDSVSAFSKLSKQSNVTKSKVDVDEKAEDFNEACSDLYKNLAGYNAKIKVDNPSNWKEAYDKYSVDYKTINRSVVTLMNDIPEAKAFIKINKTAVGYPYYVEGEFSADIKETTLPELKAARDSIVAELDKSEFNIKYMKTLTEYVKKYGTLTLSEKSQYLILYKDYMDKIALLVKYDEKCKEVSKTETVLDPKSNNRLIDAASISEKAKLINDSINDEKKKIDKLCKDEQKNIVDKIIFVNDSIITIDKALGQIGTVRKAAGDVNTANGKLGSSLTTYNGKDGTDAFSSGMDQEYKYNAKAFDVKSIDELEKQLVAHKKFLESVKPILEGVKYSNTPIKNIDNFEAAKKALGETYKQKIVEDFKINPLTINDAYADKIFAEVFKPSPYPVKIPSTSYVSELVGGFWNYLVSAFSTQVDDTTGAEEAKNSLADTAMDASKGKTKDSEISSVAPNIFAELPSGTGKGASAVNTELNLEKKKNTGFLKFLDSMSSTVSSLLDPAWFANAAAAGRDNLYVTDYVFNMFSFNTQAAEYKVENKGDTEKLAKPIVTATGIKLNAKNNAMFGSEIEYMLYGSNTPKDNVAKAKGNIFAIRFVANAGYALTNAEIRSETLPPALAIQLASGGFIPYKLPQVVMQLCLALAESEADIKAMEAGQKVAIIKSNDTWVMSVKGGINVAKDAIKNKTEDAIVKKSEEVKGALGKLIDNTGEKVTVKKDELVADVTVAATAKTTEAVGQIFNIFSENLLTSLDQTVNNVREGKNGTKNSEELAKEITDGALKEVNTYIDSQPEGLVKTIMKEYLGSINKLAEDVSTRLQAAIEQLNNKSSAELINGIEKDVATKVADAIKGLTDNINDRLESTMENFAKKIKTGGDDYIDMAAADVVKITDGFLDETFANVSKKLPNIAGKAGKKDSITSILKFGYSDYLKMFLFLNLCADDDKVVRRVADVIQINVGNGFADTTPLYKHAKGTGFRMKNANTYIEINATVKLKTMFLDLPMVTKYTGKKGSYFEIKYKSALGY